MKEEHLRTFNLPKKEAKLIYFRRFQVRSGNVRWFLGTHIWHIWDFVAHI